MKSHSTASTIIKELNTALKGSSFRSSASPAAWLDVNSDFNVRVQRGWREFSDSCYLILFKGDGQTDYILELDTAFIARSKGLYSWSLNRPTNAATLQALIATLGPLTVRGEGYRETVRTERESRGQPKRVGPLGFPLADNGSFDSMIESLVALFAAVGKAHGGSWPAIATVSTKDLPQLSELELDLEGRISKAKKDTSANRRARLAVANKKPAKTFALTAVFQRNADVIAEVLDRASGHCELCKSPAPFSRKKGGAPYLEVHHRIQLSKGGEDSVENAVATCPNCHRRAHFG